MACDMSGMCCASSPHVLFVLALTVDCAGSEVRSPSWASPALQAGQSGLVVPGVSLHYVVYPPPPLLLQLCQLSSSLGDMGSSMQVALTFGFFGMLRQSNLAPILSHPVRQVKAHLPWRRHPGPPGTSHHHSMVKNHSNGGHLHSPPHPSSSWPSCRSRGSFSFSDLCFPLLLLS